MKYLLTVLSLVILVSCKQPPKKYIMVTFYHEKSLFTGSIDYKNQVDTLVCIDDTTAAKDAYKKYAAKKLAFYVVPRFKQVAEGYKVYNELGTPINTDIPDFYRDEVDELFLESIKSIKVIN